MADETKDPLRAARRVADEAQHMIDVLSLSKTSEGRATLTAIVALRAALSAPAPEPPGPDLVTCGMYRHGAGNLVHVRTVECSAPVRALRASISGAPDAEPACPWCRGPVKVSTRSGHLFWTCVGSPGRSWCGFEGPAPSAPGVSAGGEGDHVCGRWKLSPGLTWVCGRCGADAPSLSPGCGDPIRVACPSCDAPGFTRAEVALHRCRGAPRSEEGKP